MISTCKEFNFEDVCKPGNTLLWDLVQDDKAVSQGLNSIPFKDLVIQHWNPSQKVMSLSLSGWLCSFFWAKKVPSATVFSSEVASY